MKKFYVPYIVFVIILGTLFIINLKNEPQKMINDAKDESLINTPKLEIKKNPVNNKVENESFFIIKSSGDNVYLFDSDDNVVEKLSIDYDNLREYDKQLFLKGIKVDSIQEVYHLIEDFSN